jgi:hypothetical protein
MLEITFLFHNYFTMLMWQFQSTIVSNKQKKKTEKKQNKIQKLVETITLVLWNNCRIKQKKAKQNSKVS